MTDGRVYLLKDGPIPDEALAADVAIGVATEIRDTPNLGEDIGTVAAAMVPNGNGAQRYEVTLRYCFAKDNKVNFGDFNYDVESPEVKGCLDQSLSVLEFIARRHGFKVEVR